MGIGQGIIGAFANPVSGVLDALSATAEGFNATFGKNREDALASRLFSCCVLSSFPFYVVGIWLATLR